MGIFFSMKERQVCILLVFSITQNAYGQAVNNFRCIDPFTINVAGNSAMIQNQLFDWSIGELSTSTFIGKAVFIISLGFLQSSYHPLLIYNNIDSFAFRIKIGPNPFSNYIIIQCEQDQLIINGIQLLDFQGKILYRLNGDYSGHQFYYKIPVEKLIHPLCILNINYTISGQIYKSKFFKLLQN